MSTVDRIAGLVAQARAIGVRFNAVAVGCSIAEEIRRGFHGELPRRVLSRDDGPLLMADQELEPSAIELREV